MSEAARDLAMSRFRLIQPYLEQRRSLQLVAADGKLSFPNRSAVGEPISEIWPYSIRAQSTRRPWWTQSGVAEDQGGDRRTCA